MTLVVKSFSAEKIRFLETKRRNECLTPGPSPNESTYLGEGRREQGRNGAFIEDRIPYQGQVPFRETKRRNKCLTSGPSPNEKRIWRGRNTQGGTPNVELIWRGERTGYLHPVDKVRSAERKGGTNTPPGKAARRGSRFAEIPIVKVPVKERQGTKKMSLPRRYVFTHTLRENREVCKIGSR